jgi:hypothetical protein
MSSLYFLAFAFLASTSLLFLLWHCRLAQLRQRELRRLEDEQMEREADLAEARMVALSGLTLVARGAPRSLIRALPTYTFAGRGKQGGGGTAAVELDVEMGGRRDQGQTLQQPAGGGGELQTQPQPRTPSNRDQPQRPASPGRRHEEGDSGGDSVGASANQQKQPPERDDRAAGEGSNRSSQAAADSSSQAAAAHSSLSNFSSSEPEECIICLSSYEDGEVVRKLPCGHAYHAQCIDAWLLKSATCPLCKDTLW